MSNNKQIFAKFLNEDILAEMGRLLFVLLNTFSSNGYHIKLFRNIDFESLEKEDRPYIRLVESIENLSMVEAVPKNTGGIVYLYDKKDSSYRSEDWQREIQVKFNIFSSYFFPLFNQSKPLLFPYPMHPLHYGANLQSHLVKIRKNKKKIRILFSGDTKGYKRNRIHYPKDKLTRSEIINAISERIADQVNTVTDESTLNQQLAGEYIQRFVMVDNGKFRIDASAWLETLSRAEFFLCPPGYVMPMCHNVIEAMAVGSIPIINYPEWLNPNLEDMVNCVIFDDREDLIRKITYVLSMKQEKIDKLRARVLEYYNENLDPASFMKTLESITDKKITLIMITDAHVANNESKLNKHSILITGKPRRIWADIRSTLQI